MTIEVRVKGHEIYYDYASEGPHRDRSTSVCVYICVLATFSGEKNRPSWD